MTSVIPVTGSADFSDLRLEKTVNGHVVTPFWTFLWKSAGVSAPQQFNSKYHEVAHASIVAFSSLLKIQYHDVIVTEKIVDGERWWRLGTKDPCELPEIKPKYLKSSISIDAREKRPALKDAGPPAIDV